MMYIKYLATTSINFLRKMLKSVLSALDERIKIKILCWKIIKSGKSICKKLINCCFQCKITNFGYLNQYPKDTR